MAVTSPDRVREEEVRDVSAEATSAQESAPLITTEATPAQESATLITNSATMFVGQLGIKAITFIFNIIVIRHLGSEQYGKFAICTAFGSLFVVLSDLGLAQLAVKRIARDRTPNLIASLVSNIVTLRVLLSLGVVALTAIVAWIVGYNEEIRFGIFIAAVGLVSYAFFGVAETLALGLERFRLSATLGIGVQGTTLVLAALFVFSGAGFLGLLAASTIAALFVALIALRRINREIPLRAPIEPRSWSRLIRDALPFAAITLALSVSYKVDAVILSLAVPVAVVGTYSVAYNLIFTTVTLSHSINLALYPAMVREHARSPESAVLLFRQGFRYLLFVSLPAAVFLSLNARGIVTLLYGPQFAGAALPLTILSWVIPLLFVSEFLGYVAIVVDREQLAARANWVSSLGNVAANVALIPIFGVIAAAAITVATEGVLVGQYVIALRQQRLFANGWYTAGATIFTTAILALILLLLRPLALPVIALGALSVATYFVIAYGTGAFGKAEMQTLSEIAGSRLRRKR